MNDTGTAPKRRGRRGPPKASSRGELTITRRKKVKAVGRLDHIHFDPITGRRRGS